MGSRFDKHGCNLERAEMPNNFFGGTLFPGHTPLLLWPESLTLLLPGLEGEATCTKGGCTCATTGRSLHGKRRWT